MLVPRKHVALLWNNDTGLVTVPADQDFNHIGHAAVLHVRSFAHGFLEAGIDSEVERCDLSACHDYNVLQKWCKCNAHCVICPQPAAFGLPATEVLVCVGPVPNPCMNMPDRLKILFSYTFRPFFLVAGIWAILAVVRWMLIQNGIIATPMRINPLYWHGHEMIVGFALAVVAGFVLSAVATWTGRPAVSGPVVVGLTVSWLLGRIAMLPVTTISPFVAAMLDMLFPIALCVLLGREVFGAKNRRNYKVFWIATALAGLNLFYQLGLTGVIEGADYVALYLLIHGIVLLVALIGGRVVPNFTANWLRGQGVTILPRNNLPIDRMAIALTMMVGLAVVFFPGRETIGYLAMSAAALHAVRVAQWQGMQTIRNPLLFIMHVAYWWLPIGYAMMSLASFGWAFTPSAALHALTMGGIGGMILAMITRVPLGHTGRALNASRLTVVAYILLMLAVVVRVLSPWNEVEYLSMLNVAAAGWCLAFAIFLWVYWPVLTQAPLRN